MYNIIAIMGKAGTGKDTVLRALASQWLDVHEIVSCTTRPAREHEIDGKNYYFLTEEEFKRQMESGDMLETSQFRGWYYGTSVCSLNENKMNIGVFNPEGVRTLSQLPNVNVFIVLLETEDKERLIRQLNREESPDVAEIVRRYGTDKVDFNYMSEWLEVSTNLFKIIKIQNNKNTSIQDIVDKITRFGQKYTNFLS